MYPCGSFRRKKKMNGDVDILITRKDDLECHKLIKILVDNLANKGFLTNHLSYSEKNG